MYFNRIGKEELKINYHPNGEIFCESIEKYDDKGLNIETTWKFHRENDSSEYKEYKAIYKYDNANRLIEQNIYFISGKLYSKKVYLYNEKDLLVGTKSFNAKEELTMSSEYMYNKNGFIEKETITKFFTSESSDYKVEYIDYEYNDKGWIVKKDLRLVVTNFVIKKQENWTYSYEKYDKKNNWTKRIDLKNNFPVYLVERKIEYW